MGGANNHSSKKYNPSRKAYKAKTQGFRVVEGVESAAYERLSPHAVWVLMEFYRKFNGFNRNNLTLSYKEMRGKIAEGTYNNAIWELLGFGFIERVRLGRLERNSSLYALTNKWKKLSAKPKKLDTIEKLLTRAIKVKRIETPKNLTDEEKGCFRLKRKQLLWKLRKAALQGKRG